MKLRNKINLYTAVLFTALLILMNVTIYYLFNHLIIGSELTIAREESKKAADVFNESLGTIDETKLLRSYLPIEGMIRIVREDGLNTPVTSLNEKDLSSLKAEYYSGEINEKIVLHNRVYAFNSIPIILPDGNVANLQVTKSIEPAINNLHSLRLVLILVTFIAIIPVFISSRLLSNLVLNPITSMIKTMSEIKESGQFKHLPFEGKSRDELSQMGDTFNHMIDLLEANFEKQKQFVSNASHELKTPLTVIESYASLLKRRGLQEPELFHESVEAIHSEAIRMRELTEQLLLLAKHNEQWNLEIRNVHLAEFLKQTVNAFETAYNRPITLELDDCSTLIIQTDESKLKQLLFIFLDNARKYSDEKIIVAAGLENNKVCIRIIDRGIGIPERDLPKIFDRFYRVDEARSRKSGGSGLGLSLAKDIADAINVELILKSQEREGTTVTLYLAKW